MKRLLTSLLGFALAFSTFQPAFADSDSSSSPVASDTNSVIVKFKDNRVDLDTSGGTAVAANLADAHNLTLTDTLSDANSAIYTSSSSDIVSVADSLENNPSVEYAEPNYSRRITTLPTNDAHNNLLWGLENTGQNVNGVSGTAGDDIKAAQAWSLSTGTSTIVAVIDDGVFYTHPDLVNQMWDGTNCVDENGNPFLDASSSRTACIHGYDFVDNDPNPMPVAPFPTNSHGTHVAGTIAAEGNNSIGIVGVAPKAKIMALRFNFDVASEVRAIDFARLNGAKVINASYGGTGFSQSEYDAITRFKNAGGIFVAAAGNNTQSNDISPIYPASDGVSNIISVAATDQFDGLASFSNFGSTTVDIGAPGVNILSTYTSDGTTSAYAYLNGTSMATPHVVGTVALLESRYPSLSVSVIKAAILSGGDLDAALAGKTTSGKRLNAYGALQAAATDTTPPVITLTGASTINLTVGDTYTELGATAIDDRDATTTVVIGGDTVSTTTPAGTYHSTYDAVDQAGNHATQVVRTIIISAPIVVSSGGGSGGGGGGGGGGGSSSSSNTSHPSGGAILSNTTPTATTTNQTRPPVLTNTVPTTATVTATHHSFTRSLSQGMANPDVTALQQALARAGVYKGPVTGYFGALTKVGVRAYQTLHGLEPIGTVGPMTRALLNQGV